MNLGIRARLVATFAAGVAVVALVGFTGWMAIRSLSREFTGLYEQNLGAATSLANAERALWELRFELANYLVRDEAGRVTIRQQQVEWFRRLESSILAYEALATSAEEKSRLAEWHAAYDEYVRARPGFLRLVDEGRLDEAKEYREKETNPAAGRATAALGELVTLQQSAGEARQRSVYALVEQAQTELAIVFLVAVVGALLASLLIARSLTLPITALIGTAEAIASGDLRPAIEGASRTDEIGQLARGFEAMLARLRELPQVMRSSVDAMGGAVRSLSELGEAQDLSLANQSAALEEAVVSAQEIEQTVSLTSQRAAEVIEVAKRAEGLSASGQEAVAQILSGLEAVGGHVTSMASHVGALVERIRAAGSVAREVKDLADQSNLLALNAAIEATRAGESGRAFAVVAREIRSLADQSIQSTQRISALLGEVESAGRATAEATAVGTTRVQSSLGQARTAGESLRALQAIVAENADTARQIAGAVTQQSAGVSQVAEVLRELRERTGGAGEAVQRSRAAMNDVSATAQRLADTVRAYQT